MRTRIAVLADYASLSQGDKLNVLGVFSNIMAAQEPITHPQMYLVIQFEFEPSEEGRKELRIVLENQEGQDTMQVNGEMMVGRMPRGQPTIVNQMLCLNGLQFPRFGDYIFRVLVNGRTQAEIPLTVTQVQTSPIPPILPGIGARND